MDNCTKFLFGERTVTYYPTIARVFDSIPAAIFVSELLQSTTENGEGWVKKTVDEWEAIGLKSSLLLNARKKLREENILEEKNLGRNGVSYRIIPDAFIAFLNGEKVEQKKVSISKPKQTEPVMKEQSSLARLSVEFKNLGLKNPVFSGGATKIAQTLVSAYGVENVARCWKDIQTEAYGKERDLKKYISFGFLARNNVIGQWIDWNNDGRKSEQYRKRFGESDLDIEEAKNAARRR